MTKNILIENHAIRDITEDTDFKYQTMEWLVGGMVTVWVTIQSAALRLTMEPCPGLEGSVTYSERFLLWQWGKEAQAC